VDLELMRRLEGQRIRLSLTEYQGSTGFVGFAYVSQEVIPPGQAG
jgi:hypothetical protein